MNLPALLLAFLSVASCHQRMSTLFFAALQGCYFLFKLHLHCLLLFHTTFALPFDRPMLSHAPTPHYVAA